MRPQVEQLEDRWCPEAHVTQILDAGVLTIRGSDAQNDTIFIKPSNSTSLQFTVSVLENGVLQSVTPYQVADVTKINLFAFGMGREDFEDYLSMISCDIFTVHAADGSKIVNRANGSWNEIDSGNSDLIDVSSYGFAGAGQETVVMGFGDNNTVKAAGDNLYVGVEFGQNDHVTLTDAHGFDLESDATGTITFVGNCRDWLGSPIGDLYAETDTSQPVTITQADGSQLSGVQMALAGYSNVNLTVAIGCSANLGEYYSAGHDTVSLGGGGNTIHAENSNNDVLYTAGGNNIIYGGIGDIWSNDGNSTDQWFPHT